MSERVLCVRLDNAGDVLLMGPAVRAVAESGAEVVVLAGPQGADAAKLLPGVSRTLIWRCPWVDPDPAPIDRDDIAGLVEVLRRLDCDRALVFTSFHQSPLPIALVLRLAGVSWIGAISEDYPGSLLDLRCRIRDDLPEPERALSLARAAGFGLGAGDGGELEVRHPLPSVDRLTGAGPYVVLHPGTSVPARAWPPHRYVETAHRLSEAGHRVVVTGSPAETGLTKLVAGDVGTDLGGRTSLAELAAVLDQAEAVVVGNTGPAHLAAAVGARVVSLFAPTVPAVRWAPYRTPHILLGDQHAPCRDLRVTHCPFPGHPCLSEVSADDVLSALADLGLHTRPTRRADRDHDFEEVVR
ncbi:MAG: glycosyltransferase family 9 protein [Nocardioidaceae bacterium]